MTGALVACAIVFACLVYAVECSVVRARVVEAFPSDQAGRATLEPHSLLRKVRGVAGHTLDHVDWKLYADGFFRASPSLNVPLRYDANGVVGCDSCDCSFIDRYNQTTNCNIERNSRAAVFKWMPEESSVLEVGARYGSTSCAIADKQKQSGRLVSFDADRLVWDHLEKNRVSHGCKFKIVRGLLGKEDGKIIENRYGTLADKSGEIVKRGVDPKSLATVPHFTLLDVQRKYGIRFDVACFDCEGCFASVMKDFPELGSQLKMMIIESHDAGEEAAVQQLLKHGWHLKDSFARQRVIARSW